MVSDGERSDPQPAPGDGSIPSSPLHHYLQLMEEIWREISHVHRSGRTPHIILCDKSMFYRALTCPEVPRSLIMARHEEGWRAFDLPLVPIFPLGEVRVLTEDEWRDYQSRVRL